MIEEGLPGSQVFAQIRNGNGLFSVNIDPGNSGTGVFDEPFVVDAAAWVPDTYTVNFTAADSYEVTDSSGTVIQTGAYAPGDSISFAGIGISLTGEPAAGDRFEVAPSRNQSVFETVQNLVDTLEGDASQPAIRAQTNSALNIALLDLDQALGNVSDARSIVGSRLSVIEQQSESNLELDQQYQQTLSTVRDVDYASAISELEQQLLGLEAAQKTYARTRAFSLFSLI